MGNPSWENPVHTSTLPRPPGSAPSGPAATWPRRSTPQRRPPPARRWERPALLALLVGTAVLYLWNLSASGYANDFYAAAVQAGTQSWKAWLFGSLDSGNAITVDKPPASLWVMTLSARIFGFSSWSLLVPQALMGVASVALLHAAVRRWAGPVAGLLAGAALALTPAAVLMFRFDNPDALLVLLLVTGAYATVRAIDAVTVRASTWWLVAAGAAVGFGFLTKMGQALLVVPAFGLAYLVAGPPRLRTRLVQLLAALGSMIVSAGWFIALVELWPADSRPVHRRLDDELAAGAGAGLQRPGPHPRRERQRRWRWLRGRQQRVRRRGRHPAAVHRRAGPRDLLAAAGGADRAGRAGRRRRAPAATGGRDREASRIRHVPPQAPISSPRRTACVRRRCCGAAGRW